jgi:bacterial/archaeal transporter family protein
MSLAVLGLVGRVVLLGVERIVVRRLGQAEDPFAATFLFFAVGSVLLTPCLFFVALDSWAFLPGAILSSLVYAAAFSCYVRSLSCGEASLVSPLYNFNIFFLALLAWLLYAEPFTPAKIGGLLCLVYGASLLNRQGSLLRSLAAVGRDTACRYMIAASLCIAVGRLIDKNYMSSVDPLLYAVILNWLVSAWLLLLAAIRGRLPTIPVLLRKRPYLSLSAGALNGYSYLCLLVALTSIDVSVAEPVGLLGLVVTMALARWVLKEDIGPRIPGVAVMLAGSWLLFL